ncbi:NUDIX hydrolase [Hyphomicrobium denitrificans]|nr:NUDIX hydrolase [Hyphomicrobium denitrificans]
MQNLFESKWFHCPDGVTRLSSCALRVSSARWAFADENAREIDAHWVEAKRSSPNYFNGIVYLVDDVAISDRALKASLLQTDFKSYLYWRAAGFPAAGVLDGFGSALIRTQDGRIMLGRQRAGNVNGGQAYAPAGFIDGQDVDAEGVIHIDRSALREVTEETGIDPAALMKDDGFYLTRLGPQLSMAVPLRVRMTTAEFVRRAEQHIAASPNSELDAIIPIAGLHDVEDLPTPRYMRVLLEAILADG